MNGFIHIYTRGKEPKSDQIIIRFDKVNAEAYDAKLHAISTEQLQKNLYARDSYGNTKHQGNIGTLRVSLPEQQDSSLAEAYQSEMTAFLGQFNGHLIEFTLSDNVKVMPTYSLHTSKRESFTVIKFHQYDQVMSCFHEVLLATKEGSLNFEVSVKESANRIRLDQWNEVFKKQGLEIDLQDTFVDVDRELFLEDIFHNVTEEALVSTGVGRAFDPTFRVIPPSDEAAVVKKPKVEPEPLPEPEKEIKVGMLMMLEQASDEEDGEELVSSDDEVPSEHDSDIDVHADPITQKYISATNSLKRRLAKECQLDMSLAPPAFTATATTGIITTPELLKKPESPIRMSELLPNLDSIASPPLSKLE